MNRPSQTKQPAWLAALAVLCVLPSCLEARAVLWGQRHGFVGKALRDGLDFWAGGRLAISGRAATLFCPAAYNHFLTNLYGPLPYHLWSYPPTYLLAAAAFAHLAPWHAVLAFDASSLLALVFLLRLARLPWLLVAAVAFSPAAIENFLEGQNAALLTALIGGGVLLLPERPRVAGLLVGLASVKPQLGLVLPLVLLRRSQLAFAWAALATLLLAAAALVVFGPGVWWGFWAVTRPAMSAVLFTGQPADFANGLISVFAALRPLGVPLALAAQAAISAAAIALAPRASAPAILILAALACPYLHDYDLLGTSLAVALLVRDRLAHGFGTGEAATLFFAWFAPGLLPWTPALAPLVPLLLAITLARATLRSCDSDPNARGSSAGRSPTPAHPASMANG